MAVGRAWYRPGWRSFEWTLRWWMARAFGSIGWGSVAAVVNHTAYPLRCAQSVTPEAAALWHTGEPGTHVRATHEQRKVASFKPHGMRACHPRQSLAQPPTPPTKHRFATAKTCAPMAAHNKTLAERILRQCHGIARVGMQRRHQDFICARNATSVKLGDNTDRGQPHPAHSGVCGAVPNSEHRFVCRVPAQIRHKALRGRGQWRVAAPDQQPLALYRKALHRQPHPGRAGVD